MTNSLPWYRWPIEIDGLLWFTYSHLLTMVIFHGKLLVRTRWYHLISATNVSRWISGFCSAQGEEQKSLYQAFVDELSQDGSRFLGATGGWLEMLGRHDINIWVCLKIVYPYTQWLMIIIPTKWL